MHTADRAFIAHTTARMLLEVKAVLFSAEKPFIFTSGWASPVYIDCRKLIFYPRIRSQLVEFAAATLARDAGIRAVRRGGGRRDGGHSVRRVDRRPARAADAVRPQEAEGLRP
jgi:orotate phosphoribosyltransferase